MPNRIGIDQLMKMRATSGGQDKKLVVNNKLKSELLSLIATYECFITNDNSEVYITGWNRDGSDIVYREIKYQLEHPFIPGFFEGKYKDSYGQITHLKSGSFIKPLSREAKNTDNANNPSLAIIDRRICRFKIG